MLVLAKILAQAMVQHALQSRPNECCGILSGPEGSDVAVRWIPMKNVAQSSDFFQFSPKEQLKVWREMESDGEEPIVIYHSHIDSDAYPSREDIEFANEPRAHYVIVNTKDDNLDDIDRLRSFRIINQCVIEEGIKLVDVPEEMIVELASV